MKKIVKIFLKICLLLFFVYLVLPPAPIPPLPNSLRSDESGDTVEIPGVSAYYTDISRAEVVSFYRAAFSRSSFLNLPLPTILLNHPPEYSAEVIRDTTKSTFLYELVHPLKESLFINGWDPNEDPKLKESKDPKQLALLSEGIYQPRDDHYYQRKITLRTFGSSLPVRLLLALLALALGGKIFSEAKRIILLLFKPKK